MDGYSYMTFDQRREIEEMYGELKRGYTGELDGNKRPKYSADLAQTTAQENFRRRGNRRAAVK